MTGRRHMPTKDSYSKPSVTSTRMASGPAHISNSLHSLVRGPRSRHPLIPYRQSQQKSLCCLVSRVDVPPSMHARVAPLWPCLICMCLLLFPASPLAWVTLGADAGPGSHISCADADKRSHTSITEIIAISGSRPLGWRNGGMACSRE